MPEEKRKNPFEDHINSDKFDVSNLGHLQVSTPEVEDAVIHFLNNMPQSWDDSLWDHALDNQQKIICHVIATDIVERILRKQYGEALQHLSDEQLIEVIKIPITLGLIAEHKFHTPIVEVKPYTHPNEMMIVESTPLSNRINTWFSRAKDFLIRLFRRV